MRPPPPISTLFPYTTLFRSVLFPLGRGATGVGLPGSRGMASGEPVLRRAGAGELLSGPADEEDGVGVPPVLPEPMGDRKSTRLNSSHVEISYAVFCLKKKIQ